MNALAFLSAMAGTADAVSLPAQSFNVAPHKTSDIEGTCSCQGSPSCHPSVNANYTISWTCSNVDASTYGIQVYNNGVLASSLSGSATSYTRTISGVQDVAGHTFSVSDSIVVKIYRLSDGTVMQASTAITHSGSYGDCTGPA